MGEVSVSLEEDAKEGALALDKNPEEEIVNMALQGGIIQDALDTRIPRASRVWTGRTNMYGGVSGVSLAGRVKAALKQDTGGSLDVHDQLQVHRSAMKWREKYLGRRKELSSIHH